ncbi:ROK family protein [Eubacterium sp. 1001713B170207_170306_E7]|uniref:ROK family protein n=1 Tax=Eubacterium sp. 1001713B170207_170306_E7 TaxID=2787097 RepID=UPI001897EC19|nr:ROK family protein [Eubacterium sp. 1001713B170207_170306_E7]
MNIGIDVGGTNLVAGLIGGSGEVLVKKKQPTGARDGYEAVLGRIEALIGQVKAEMKGESPANVGIGVPGIVSADGKTVVSCPNLFWENKPLKGDLEEKTGLPVYLANDATVAGIAENRFGSSRGCRDAVMFTLGTGVGGSVIAGGRIISGAHGVASEFGHMIVGEGLYRCNCGKMGCLETYSSATAVIWLAKKRIEQGRETEILSLAGGDPEAVNAEMVIDAAKNGDAVGLECFDSLVDHLAIAISNLVDVLDPELCVLGGGVAHAGSFLLEAVQKSTAEKITYKSLVKPEIVLATLQNDAGLVGASCIKEYLYD